MGTRHGHALANLILKTFSYDPVTLPLEIYTREMKAHSRTNTYTQIFAAVLFVTAQMWKPPRCPWMGEWVSKL